VGIPGLQRFDTGGVVIGGLVVALPHIPCMGAWQVLVSVSRVFPIGHSHLNVADAHIEWFQSLSIAL